MLEGLFDVFDEDQCNMDVIEKIPSVARHTTKMALIRARKNERRCGHLIDREETFDGYHSDFSDRSDDGAPSPITFGKFLGSDATDTTTPMPLPEGAAAMLDELRTLLHLFEETVATTNSEDDCDTITNDDDDPFPLAQAATQTAGASSSRGNRTRSGSGIGRGMTPETDLRETLLSQVLTCFEVLQTSGAPDAFFAKEIQLFQRLSFM